MPPSQVSPSNSLGHLVTLPPSTRPWEALEEHQPETRPAAESSGPLAAAPFGGLLRSTLELGVLMVFLVLSVRVFLAEAYIVPTGSMAPTLRGYHKQTHCPACGCPIAIGRLGSGLVGDADEEREARAHYAHACCPNCGCADLKLDQVGECSGDRLIVHKHIFALRPPRRWEPIVFENPLLTGPQAAEVFVKRVVGLPGETVQLVSGRVRVNGRAARKDYMDVKAVRQLLYDDRFPPRDAPHRFRWQAATSDGWRAYSEPRCYNLSEENSTYAWLCYHHLTRASRSGAWTEAEPCAADGYNGGSLCTEPIRDLMLDLDLTAGGVGWLAVALTDGFDDVMVEIPVGQPCMRARLTRRPTAPGSCGDEVRGGTKLADAADACVDLSPRPCIVALEQPIRIEVGLFDRCLFVVVGGDVIWDGFKLPDAEARERAPVWGRSLARGGRAPVSIGARGASLSVRNLALYHDLTYTTQNGREFYPNGVREPVRLGAGEFFVLGDNTASSYDSRCWPQGPAVRSEWLIGKPCLLHLPTRLCEWQADGTRRALAVPDWERVKVLR